MTDLIGRTAGLPPGLSIPFLHGSSTPHGALHPFGADTPMLDLACGRRTCVLPHTEREDDMSESVYKVIELIGTSKDSWEKAAAAAVNRAGKSLRDLRVAEVVKLDLQLDAKGQIEAYRAKLNVSFKFED
jgi:flavin-binding protein dodecin